MKKYGVTATFFLVGKMIAGREETVALARKDGHEFGNHTFSHTVLWFRSKKYIEAELRRCDEALQKVGIVTDLVRFPELKYGPNAVAVCKKLRKKIISVDVLSLDQNTYDWYRPWLKHKGLAKGPVSIERVVENTVQKARNGSILAFHDYLQNIGPHPEVSAIVERVLPALIERGFTFVPVGKMLAQNDL